MPWMKIRGEITSFDVTPKEQVEDESLRQKDSYWTQLWRAFTYPVNHPRSKYLLRRFSM